MCLDCVNPCCLVVASGGEIFTGVNTEDSTFTSPSGAFAHNFSCPLTHRSRGSFPYMSWIESNASNWTSPPPMTETWGRVSGIKLKSFWSCYQGFDSLTQPTETRLWWDAGLQQSYRNHIRAVSPWLRHATTTPREEKNDKQAEVESEGEITGKKSQASSEMVACPKSCAAEHIGTIKAFTHMHRHTHRNCDTHAHTET